jgi:hypothetical protein
MGWPSTASTTPVHFLGRARDYLLAREAEHMLGVTSTSTSSPSSPMRKAVLPALPLAAALLLAACAMPTGIAVEECNTSWQGVDPVIAGGATDDQQPVPISCIRTVDEKRISIGFELPAGPDCYELASIGLVESADAVSVTLFAALIDDIGGSCSPDPVRSVTEVDLQAPVGDRTLLDGSR